jgi:hypothetical protein
MWFKPDIEKAIARKKLFEKNPSFYTYTEEEGDETDK